MARPKAGHELWIKFMYCSVCRTPIGTVGVTTECFLALKANHCIWIHSLAYSASFVVVHCFTSFYRTTLCIIKINCFGNRVGNTIHKIFLYRVLYTYTIKLNTRTYTIESEEQVFNQVSEVFCELIVLIKYIADVWIL